MSYFSLKKSIKSEITKNFVNIANGELHTYQLNLDDYYVSITDLHEMIAKKKIKKLSKNKLTEKIRKTIEKTHNDLAEKRYKKLSREIIRMIVKYLSTKKVVLTVNDDAFYTLSLTTSKNLIKSLKIYEEKDIITKDSDGELISTIINHIHTINIETLEESIRKRTQGRFFKYIHKFKDEYLINELKKYGIFNEINRKNYKNNCFYVALKNAGLNKIKLKALKELINDITIPKKQIKSICESLNIGINLKCLMGNTVKLFKYNIKNKTIFNIGLIDEHYFVIDNINITPYSITHYDTVKNLKNFRNIKTINPSGKVIRDYNRFMNSFNLIRLLLNNKNLLHPIEECDEIFASTLYNKVEKSCNNLSYIKTNIKQHKNIKAYKKEISNDGYYYRKIKTNINGKISYNTEKYKKIFFDFETYNHNDKSTNLWRHKEFLCCKTELINNKYKTSTFIGKNCVKDFLNSITENSLLIAHNAGYDFRFLIGSPNLIIKNYIDKNRSLLSCSADLHNKVWKNGKYENKSYKLLFKDSYQHISSPLSSFKKLFSLEGGKEIMPYSYYTEETVNKPFGKYEDIVKFIKKEDIEQFNNNIKKWDLETSVDNEKYIDMVSYASKYCEIDCEVLAQGYKNHREKMFNLTKLDIDDYLTQASLSFDNVSLKNCFKGCYSISGVPRSYIQDTVEGGKVMVRNNEMVNYKGESVYIDINSLYPTAIYEFDGALLGTPKIFEEKIIKHINNLNHVNKINYLSKYDGYFIKIKVLDLKIKRAFPILSIIDENGIRKYTNDVIGKIFKVNKYKLENAIEFQKIDFEIIDGYFYNEGRSKNLNKEVKNLYDKREKMKKEIKRLEKIINDLTNNSDEILTNDKNYKKLSKIKIESNLLKLLMNSVYGKTIMKPIETETKIFNTEDKFKTYMSRNYHLIKIGYKLKVKNSDKYKYIVKVNKPINNHFTYPHIGSEILSYSKRIMNRIICLAEDLGILVLYTDTDSISLERSKLDLLVNEFEKKYGTKLLGTELGQLHIDFELEGASDIYADKSIYLGKKCYISSLIGKSNGKEIRGYHVRMRSIPKYSIEDYAKSKNMTLYQVYEELFNGKEIEFNLLCNNNKKFEYHGDFSISFKDKFTRKIKF